MKNMKKLMFSLVLLVTTVSIWAQDEEQQSGFKKQNLFTGGSVTVSFYSGGTILGANPIFGYKIANWLDAGVALNYTYQGSRDNYVVNDKIRQHVFGPGVFTRIFPIPSLFLHAQAEHNFNNWAYEDPASGYKQNDVTDANSLLLGGGWAQGRQRGSNSFFYIEILFDVLKNKYSPYVNNVYDPSTGTVARTDALPIFRGGINIALFQGKNKSRENEEPGNGRRQPHSYQGY
jgi:hypothetical protein